VRSLWARAGFFVALLLVIYLPGLGHGLIRDDYAWIAGSRVGSWRELPELFSRHNGFYRPVVSLSFWLDEQVFGLEPWGYGLTNLAFFLGDVGMIVVLARGLGMGTQFSLVAALLWAFNPHGINMALLWSSGRTALLLVLFALLSAFEFWRRHAARAALWFLAALLSKEEALLLPATLLVWGYFQGRSAAARDAGRAAAIRVLPLVACVVLYLLLRAQTGAYTPGTAPDFYRPTLDLSAIAANLLQYADRACTFPLAIALVVALAARAVPKPDDRERAWIALGVAWLVCGYAITLFLPVRSSLYACFPSVGAALAATALVSASARDLSEAKRSRLLFAAGLLAALLVPIYWGRNVRWVEPAKVASRVLRAVRLIARDAPESVLVFQDDPSTSNNLSGAFGGLLEDAVRLASGRPELRVWLEPPPPGSQPAPLGPRRTLRLRNGELRDVTGTEQKTR